MTIMVKEFDAPFNGYLDLPRGAKMLAVQMRSTNYYDDNAGATPRLYIEMETAEPVVIRRWFRSFKNNEAIRKPYLYYIGTWQHQFEGAIHLYETEPHKVTTQLYGAADSKNDDELDYL